jgi:hypothetical protein
MSATWNVRETKRERNWVCPPNTTNQPTKNAVGGGRSGVVVDVPIGGCGCVVTET